MGAKGGSVPPALEEHFYVKERGKDNSALLMLSTDMIFSHFLLTFFCQAPPQQLITCHEIQQWLEAYVCEK